jgi:hypothetical protein
MNYQTKQITLTVTIPKTEFSATDYICFFSNNGSGDVDLNNAFSPKIISTPSGTNYSFVYRFIVRSPATWKFKYKAYDASGNAGTTSGEFTADASTLVPSKAPYLLYVSYNASTKIMTFRI